MEKTHAFGQVTEGDKVTHVFTVRNVGVAPLLINRVTTSCGCTAAVLSNKEVAPGGEGHVEVTFDTEHRTGDNRKTITFLSNDPSSPRVELEIRASVEALLAFEPGFVRLNPEIGKRQVSEVWLTGKLKEQARLKIVNKSTDSEVNVTIANKTLGGGVEVQGLRFVATGKKAGFGDGNLSLETGLTKPDKLQIGYHWRAAGNIQVMPEQLYFSDAKGGSSDRVLRVTSRKADFELLHARIVSGPFVASVAMPDSGIGSEVHISLKKGVKLPQTAVREMGRLELVSNDPLEPTKVVPLRFAPSFSSSAIQGEPAGLPGHSNLQPATPTMSPPLGFPHLVPPSSPQGR